MRISGFIEKYFWIFLISGILSGLWNPLPFKTFPAFLPKTILGMMLLLVFLKIDSIKILENIRNYKLMIYVSLLYMIIIPVFFYFSIHIFNPDLAIGILLLTAMPAGVSTPALTDIVKGNVPLSMSLTIISQMISPLTVPLLFWMISFNGHSIDKLLMLKDMAIIVFLPMILSQVIKKYLPDIIKKTRHLYTSFNVLLLFSFVYMAISSQRKYILDNPVSMVWKVAVLYLVFILLHIIGYLICFRQNKEDRIAVAIGAAYMNNGMAIVLAASYFKPDVLVLMVLSELPWNTLLGPFRKVTSHLK
jgi:bile acid:Na+ symporter, BASS family